MRSFNKENSWMIKITALCLFVCFFFHFFTCSIPTLLPFEYQKTHSCGSYEKQWSGSDQRGNRMELNLPKKLLSQKIDTIWELPSKIPFIDLAFVGTKSLCSESPVEGIWKKKKISNNCLMLDCLTLWFQLGQPEAEQNTEKGNWGNKMPIGDFEFWFYIFMEIWKAMYMCGVMHMPK